MLSYGTLSPHKIYLQPDTGFHGLRLRQRCTFDMIRLGKFIPVDQSQWLFTHSGMKIPTEKLFKNVIRDRIMSEIKEHGGGFGTYPKQPSTGT